ncbi:uncharacterized protein LOC130216584 [Danio aesculapii]|uniref:uncharacterized protein LOC130216584 n=1 Tax=Danio aesculapii TaxID=1142201 RepID=UPI0024C0218E|nr:uncharacterized protein LOC130216584 [Danio aesculapii]
MSLVEEVRALRLQNIDNDKRILLLHMEEFTGMNEVVVTGLEIKPCAVSADVKSHTVKAGDSLTLNTNITKQQTEPVLWYFNDTRIALINGDSNKSCLYDGEGGRFRDRLEVNYESGSLTITNITAEHTGRYEARIIRSESTGTSQNLNRKPKCDGTKVIQKEINVGETLRTLFVSVSGVFNNASETFLKVGGSVSLNTDVIKQPQVPVLWYFNDTLIALINGDPNKSCLYDGAGGIFKDRLEVDYETGSLNITNLTAEHTGRYEAEIIRIKGEGTSQSMNRKPKCDGTKVTPKNNSLGDTIKTYFVSVSGVSDSWLSAGAVAGICVAVLLIAVLVGLLIYCLWNRDKRGKYHLLYRYKYRTKHLLSA